MVDFDGTVTEDETLDAVVELFGDADAHRAAQEELGQSLTLHDVISRGYGSLRATRAEVIAWLLENVRFRRGFADFVSMCRDRGWRVVVISSGVRELIEPLLEREGVDGLEVVANELERNRRWRVAFRETAVCSVCGEPCKRRAFLDAVGDGPSIYIGDGYSDGCAASAATRVYARRRLVDYLRERGVPYLEFRDFAAVSADLHGRTPR